jgi:cytosine/adenosine deaminase-related metal-dependent hydrolase
VNDVARNVVLEHARIVAHDSARDGQLAFSEGCVAENSFGALRIDLHGDCVFPGFINAHDHLQLNAIPRLEHAEPFPNSYAWIDAFDAHRRRARVVSAVAVAIDMRMRQGALKNVLAGATTVAHHDPWHSAFDDTDFPVDVVRRYGWAHSLGLGLGLATDGGATRYGPGVRESFCATAADAPWMIHLAEGTDDGANDELTQLDAMECLAANTVVIHGVGLRATDIDRIIAQGAGAVWCPSSNLEMLGATLDPRSLFDARRLALGTDSRLTGARDLLDEVALAAANSDLAPNELLRLVTSDASGVLRLSDRGALSVGQRADCVIIRALEDPYEGLLRTDRSAIRAVVRGGAPVIADPDFADWFAFSGTPTVAVTLDGRRKLMAEWLACPSVVALEPGLSIVL